MVYVCTYVRACGCIPLILNERIYYANVVHCGASESELYRVFIGSMVVTYILHVCSVYMHNAVTDRPRQTISQ